MELQTITNGDISIIVIKDASGASKTVFNAAYRQALTKYIDSGNCPNIATNWLQNIISNTSW